MNLFALSVELGMDTSEFERGVSQAKAKTVASVTEMKSQYKSLASSLGGYQSAFNKAAAQYGTSSQSAQKYSAKIDEQKRKLDECRKSLEAVGVSVEDVGRKMESASTKTENLSTPFSGLSKTLTGAFTKSQLIATAITSLAGKFVSLGEGVAKQGTDFNQAMEKYRVAFTNMLGSAEQAQAVLNQIKQDAAHTPLNVDSLVQANQLLISAGVDAGKARSTILALGDAVSATGGGNDALSRMAANLQQIKNVGKASAVDIKQFAMAGIDIYGVLADYTGKSTAEVQKMTITYDLLTAALQKASEEGGRYYNAMETQSQTMSGRIETLKDNWSQLLGTLTEGLTETEGKLVNAASGWVQRLQEAFETAGANGLMQAGGHIVDDIATGISNGVPGLAAQAAGAVQNFALYLQDNTGQIVDTGGQLLTSLANGILSTAPVVANAAVQTVSSLAVELWNNADKIFTAGADLLGKLVEGFLSLTGNVIEAAGNITAAIITKIFTTDWVQVGKDIVSSIGQGIQNGISAMSGPLDRLSYKLNHALGKNGYAEYDTFEAWAAANGKTSETRYQQGSQKDDAYWKRYGDKLAQQYGLNETGLDTGSGGADTTSGGDTTKAQKTKSTTEKVIASTSHTTTTQTANDLGVVTTSIQTLTEKVKDSAGNIKDRITETTTTTGKEMVNGVATTFKQVETKVNGTVTKVTKTYDDMSKTLLGTLVTTATKLVDGVSTVTQQTTEKYADGSERIKQIVTETGERIVNGALETYTRVKTIVDGHETDTKETTEAVVSQYDTLLSAYNKAKKNVDELRAAYEASAAANGESSEETQRLSALLAESEDTLTDAAAAWREYQKTTSRSYVVTKNFADFLKKSNSAFADFGGSISELGEFFGSEAIQGVGEFFTEITDGVDKVMNLATSTATLVETLQQLSTTLQSIKTAGGVSTLLSGAGKLLGIGGTAAATGAAGTAATGAAGSGLAALGISVPEIGMILLAVLGVGAVGYGIYKLVTKNKEKDTVSSAMSYKDLQDAYWYGNERAFAGYDYRTDPYTFNPNNSAVLGYQAKMQEQMARLTEVVQQYLPDVANQQIVLDDGTLVGKMAPGMDAQLGQLQALAERGN